MINNDFKIEIDDIIWTIIFGLLVMVNINMFPEYDLYIKIAIGLLMLFSILNMLVKFIRKRRSRLY